MGNQQERSLAWLAGIIDGEGSISFQVYTLPDSRIRITPFVSVTNSDEGILSETKRIMDELLEPSKNGRLRRCKDSAHSESSYKSRKPCGILRVDGIAVKWVLEAILPYLRSTKRGNAENILAYLKSREDGLLMRDPKGRLQRVGYRLSEVQLVAATRTHKRAKSSEAICSAPNVIG